MKKFLLITLIFVLNLLPVIAKTDRMSAEYLKNKRHFAIMNPIAESTAQKIIKKALRKEVGEGDYKVKFSAYTLSSLRKGIFKSIEIQGKDLEIELIRAYNEAKRRFRKNEETISRLTHSLYERRQKGERIGVEDEEQLDLKIAMDNLPLNYAKISCLYNILFNTGIYQKYLKDTYTGEIIID